MYVPALYDFHFKLANLDGGPSEHLTISQIAPTQPNGLPATVGVPATEGDWDSYTDVATALTAPIQLQEGKISLKTAFEGGFNFDAMVYESRGACCGLVGNDLNPSIEPNKIVAGVWSDPEATAIINGAGIGDYAGIAGESSVVEAEDYRPGRNGVAYQDMTAGNAGVPPDQSPSASAYYRILDDVGPRRAGCGCAPGLDPAAAAAHHAAMLRRHWMLLAAGCLLAQCSTRDRGPSLRRLFDPGSLAWIRLGGELREAIGGVPGAPFTQSFLVTKGDVVDLAVGLRCPAREGCAGTWRFRIEASPESGSALPLFEQTLDANAPEVWQAIRVRLTQLAGSRVDLTFRVASLSGPPPGRASALPYWGRPSLLRAGPTSRPNVVLISVDTLRADRLGCYGYGRPTSPHIDAFAREGVRFETAVSQAPWTTPSHISLLTSLYPSTHRVNQGWGELDRFQHGRSGYRVLAEEVTTLAEAFAVAGYRTLALTGGGPISGDLGFAQGFDVYRESNSLQETGPQLFDWLRQYDGVPFLLFFHTFVVHAPYTSTQLTGEVLTAQERLELDAAWERLPLQDVSAYERLLRELGHFRKEVTSALYDGDVQVMDMLVGQFFDEMRRRHMDERTLVVLTADHGEEFGEHDPSRFYDAHCRTVYDEVIRVPLLLRLPGKLPAGTVVRSPVELIDVAPTILDLAGIETPRAMQGRSLLPLVRGGSHRQAMSLTEATCDGPEIKALRGERLKYVAEYGLGAADGDRSGVSGPRIAERLFDLSSDPRETRPVSAGRKMARMREALEARLDAATRDATSGQAQPLDPRVLEQLRSLGYLR